MKVGFKRKFGFMDPIPQIIIAESPNLSTLIVVNIQFPMEDGGVNRTVTDCRQIAEPVGPNGQKLGGLKGALATGLADFPPLLTFLNF